MELEAYKLWFKKTVGKTLYSYQERILTNRHPRNIIVKSRQTGISTLMACYGLSQALIGKKVLIVSPSYRQSGHVMDIVRDFLNNIPHPALLEEMKTSIRFEGGGEIRSLPNSANTVRGFTADLIILDEMAHFLNGTDVEIMKAIAPSLSRGGELWLVSTPNGEQGLYYEYSEKRKDYNKIIVHWSECEDLKNNEAELRRLCPDPLTFAQEYDNKFLGNVETEFPWNLLHACTNPDIQYENPIQSFNVFVGVDIGRKVDQTATIGVSKPDKIWRVVYKNIMEGTAYKAQEHFLNSLISTYRLVRMNIDESGIGSMIAENLRDRNSGLVFGYQFTNELKQKLVVNIKRLLVNKLIELPDDAQLLNSLHSIKRQYSTAGNIRFDADRTEETGHADTAWALMLAVFESEQNTEGILPIGSF